MPKNSCIMQIWAESGKSALPICNYSQILYQFLTFTQNLKRSPQFGHFINLTSPLHIFLLCNSEFWLQLIFLTSWSLIYFYTRIPLHHCLSFQIFLHHINHPSMLRLYITFPSPITSNKDTSPSIFSMLSE